MTSDSDVESITLIAILEHTTCRLLDSDLPRTYRNVSLTALQLVSDALKYGVVYPLLGYDLLGYIPNTLGPH